MDVFNEMMETDCRLEVLFEGRLGPAGRQLLPAVLRLSHFRFPFAPASNVFRRNGELVIDLDLPGIDPAKDVTVAIDDGELVVRGQRRHSEEIKDEDYQRREWSYGIFERRIGIPQSTKKKDLKTTYKDGILEVVVPAGTAKLKRTEVQGRKPTGTKRKAAPVKAASGF